MFKITGHELEYKQQYNQLYSQTQCVCVCVCVCLRAHACVPVCVERARASTRFWYVYVFKLLFPPLAFQEAANVNRIYSDQMASQ